MPDALNQGVGLRAETLLESVPEEKRTRDLANSEGICAPFVRVQIEIRKNRMNGKLTGLRAGGGRGQEVGGPSDNKNYYT
jgi:hypothetical protein